MKKLLSIGFACLLTALLFCSALPVSAAGAAVTVSASSASVTVGDTVTVTVKYTADSIGSFKSELTYNTAVLQYVSAKGDGTFMPTGDAGVTTVLYVANSEIKTYSFSVTFKAKAAGSCDVALKTTEMIDWNTAPLGTPSGKATVSVKNPSLSSNANLTALYISSGSLSPKFSPDTTSYNIVIPYAVTTLTVSATTADKNAKLEVTGSKEMKVGKNTRTVKVTAPDGTVKSYTLNITRQENTGSPTNPSTGATKPPENNDAAKVTVGEETRYIAKDLKNVTLPVGYEQTTLTVNDTVFPAVQNSTRAITLLYLTDEKAENGAFYVYNTVDMTFSVFVSVTVNAGTYAFLSPDSAVSVPEDFSQTFLELGGQTVAAWTFPDETMKEYYLVYALSPAGNTALYQYDSVEGTFQRYTAQVKQPDPADTAAPEEETPSVGWFARMKQGVTDWAARMGVLRLCLIAGGVLVALIGMIVVIVLFRRRPKNYKH